MLTYRRMEFETHYDSDSDSCDEDPFMGAVGVYERMLNQVDISYTHGRIYTSILVLRSLSKIF